MSYFSNPMRFSSKLSQIINEEDESVDLSVEIVPDNASAANLTHHLQEINRRNFTSAPSSDWQELLARLNSVRRVQNESRTNQSSKGVSSDQFTEGSLHNSEPRRLKSPNTAKPIKQATYEPYQVTQTDEKVEKRRVKLVPPFNPAVCANKYCVHSVTGEIEIKQLKRVHDGQIQSFCSGCAKAISKRWVCCFCQRIFIPLEQSKTADNLTWIGCDSKGCTRWTHLECAKAQGWVARPEKKFFCHDCENEPDFMRPMGVKLTTPTQKHKNVTVELPASNSESDHKNVPKREPSTRSTCDIRPQCTNSTNPRSPSPQPPKTLDFTLEDTKTPSKPQRSLPRDTMGLMDRDACQKTGEQTKKEVVRGKRGADGEKGLEGGDLALRVADIVGAGVRRDQRVRELRKTTAGASRFNETREIEAILYRYSETYSTIDSLVGSGNLRLSEDEIFSDLLQFSDNGTNPEYLLSLLQDSTPQPKEDRPKLSPGSHLPPRAQNFPMRLRQKLKPKSGGFS